MSKQQKIITILIIISLFFTASFSVANAATTKKVTTKSKPFTYQQIFYYQPGKVGFDSFSKNWKYVDVIAPQSYSIDLNGEVTGSVASSVIDLAAKRKIKVMPLVTNKDFNRANTEAFLDDTAKQALAISELVREGLENNYWGWQVDFEAIDVSYRDKFSNFVKNLHDALTSQAMILSVAVIPQVSQNPADYPVNSWQYMAGVFDYAALAENSDFISLMAYDDPYSRGPIARYNWVKQQIEYALKLIPKEKLSLGIPLYYWKWKDATGKRIDAGGYAGIKNVLNTYRTTYGYNTTYQAPYIKYRANKVNYTLWYENGRSIQKKLDLITQYKLHSFSAWSIGLEVPSVYQSIKVKNK